MKLLKRWLPLIIIFLIAVFLRFYKLGSVPNGLYQDETAIGYNAYSIIETGRDEYGVKYPLYFKSFGDYKLPVYIYLTAITTKFFGLSAWAVRLPSAFFGSLTIPLLYFFVYSLFKKSPVALLASLMLAINPWHLHYSRATFEVTIALFFFILGAMLLPRRQMFGTLCFIVAFYTYNLTRLLAPFLYVLTIQHFKIKPKLYTVIFALILLLPFFTTFFTGGGAKSAVGTYIFTSASVQAPLLEFRSYVLSFPFSKLFFNQIVTTLWTYIQNITRYLSVEFFFLSGSTHGNHGIGNFGQFYLFELPLIILGFQYHLLLVGWIALTIVVASLTREAPHATRSFFLMLPFVIYSSLGLLKVNEWLKSRKIFTIIVALFVTYNLIYYFSSYYFRFPIYYTKQWRSADQELSLFLASHQNDYDKIIIDKDTGFVYTSLLFYTQYSPSLFQQTVNRLPDDSEGFSEVLSFGKYEFKEINENDFHTPDALIITTLKNKPDTAQAIQTFLYPARPVVIAIKQQIAQYPTQETAYVAISSTK